MEAKISVIIPAYNAAVFLPACLDSILSQSLRELEVIIIDDGSSDATPAICSQYAGADARVRVVSTHNAGVSAARNAGILRSSGEFIWFVDADDTVEPGACAALYALAVMQGADAVVFDFSRVEGSSDSWPCQSVFTGGTYEGDSIVNDLLARFIGFSYSGIHCWLRGETGGLYVENPALWRTLLRGDVIRDSGLLFDPSLRVGEDTIFLSLFLSYASRVIVTHSLMYRQLLHSASVISLYENDPEAKLENKTALMAARLALSDDISARRGISVHHCWQGSVVMSYMELCFMFARRSSGRTRQPAGVDRQLQGANLQPAGASFSARYRRFLSYAKDPCVAETLAAYPPLHMPKFRSLPFWLMRKRLHRILFTCAAILSLTHYSFIRE